MGVLPGAQLDRLANADLRVGPRYVDRLLSTTSVRNLLKAERSGEAGYGSRHPDRDCDQGCKTSRWTKPSDLLLEPITDDDRRSFLMLRKWRFQSLLCPIPSRHRSDVVLTELHTLGIHRTSDDSIQLKSSPPARQAGHNLCRPDVSPVAHPGIISCVLCQLIEGRDRTTVVLEFIE